MLRKRDTELIAGLVEGTLEDETEARALLERSDEARAEYEAQRIVYSALRSAPAPSLSPDERSVLRREIWTELRRDPSSAPGRAPWIYRVAAPVTAALVLVVGVVALLNQGFQGSADETANTLAGALSSDTTESATSEFLESAEDGASAPADDGSAGGDQAAEDLSPEAMEQEEFFSTVAELVRSGGLATASRLQRYSAGEPDFQDAESCLERAGLTDYAVFGEATNVEPGDQQMTPTRYLVLTRADAEIGPETEVTFVSIEACEIVHIED